MLELGGMELNRLPVSDLTWVKDLIYFDGPLLSQFRHARNGESYLYYWCDCDENVNRWMVLRVSEDDLKRLLSRLIPLGEIIPKGSQDDFVYIVDLDGRGEVVKVRLLGVEAVPPAYTPEAGAFLDTADARIPVVANMPDNTTKDTIWNAYPVASETVFGGLFKSYNSQVGNLQPIVRRAKRGTSLTATFGSPTDITYTEQLSETVS